MVDTQYYRESWEPTEEEMTPRDWKDPDEAPSDWPEPDAESPHTVIEVWGETYGYYGEQGAELRDKILNIKRGMFLERLPADATEQAIEAATYPFTQDDGDSLRWFLQRFVEFQLDRGTHHIERATEDVARFIVDNPPLVEFIATQDLEGLVRDSEPILIDGPVHRAVKDVRATLESLRQSC